MAARGRVVVGYDGSAGSAAAVRLAAAEAAASGGLLHLVHAQLTRSAYALLLPPGAVGAAAVEAERLVAAARARLHQDYPDLPVRPAVVLGGPGAALVRAARGATLLVVGRTGSGPDGVAAHVMAGAACPVTVVGGDAAPPWHSGGRPVVLGFDAAAALSPAVPFAFGAARLRGAGLRVCHVRCPGDDPWARDADARREVSEALAGWRAAHPDVPVAVDVLTGVDPAARLLDAAADAVLVVLGGRGAGRPGRIADVVTRNAACPVTVVRAAGRLVAVS
ncbi:universal stress protein [Dactylosporangium sp. NPDC051485]|uniref:universal stress protein n=1 Tax=Dactylosporangium sp. NPDC051485 TaxID=3154846 RepID=UPI0034297AB5